MTQSYIVERCVVERQEASEQFPGACDGASLSALYSRHGAWLVSALRRRFGREMADDLAQEVYLRLSGRPFEHEIRSPKAFLMTVASRLAIDAERKRRRQALLEQSVSVEDRAPGEVSSQLEYVALKEAILTLSKPQREAFLLSRFRGLTNQAISERLGISVKTVEWRIARALEHCAERMRD